MLRIVTAGLTALFVTASPLAYAQTAANAATPTATDWNTLTDMRIDVVKAALQLTPDQEKYSPAIEAATITGLRQSPSQYSRRGWRLGFYRT